MALRGESLGRPRLLENTTNQTLVATLGAFLGTLLVVLVVLVVWYLRSKRQGKADPILHVSSTVDNSDHSANESLQKENSQPADLKKKVSDTASSGPENKVGEDGRVKKTETAQHSAAYPQLESPQTSNAPAPSSRAATQQSPPVQVATPVDVSSQAQLVVQNEIINDMTFQNQMLEAIALSMQQVSLTSTSRQHDPAETIIVEKFANEAAANECYASDDSGSEEDWVVATTEAAQGIAKITLVEDAPPMTVVHPYVADWEIKYDTSFYSTYFKNERNNLQCFPFCREFTEYSRGKRLKKQHQSTGRTNCSEHVSLTFSLPSDILNLKRQSSELRARKLDLSRHLIAMARVVRNDQDIENEHIPLGSLCTTSYLEDLAQRENYVFGVFRDAPFSADAPRSKDSFKLHFQTPVNKSWICKGDRTKQNQMQFQVLVLGEYQKLKSYYGLPSFSNRASNLHQSTKSNASEMSASGNGFVLMVITNSSIFEVISTRKLKRILEGAGGDKAEKKQPTKRKQVKKEKNSTPKARTTKKEP